MEKIIRLVIDDFSCPPPFQEAYIKEICEKENVKVVDWYDWKEKLPYWPGYFKGKVVLLKS